MPSTRANKIITITNDENYDLAAHMARMADSTNVAVPVADQAARDALGTPWVGLRVIRADRNNHIQMWVGSAWRWVSPPEFYFMDASTFSTTTSQVSKLIATLTTVPVRSYATQVRVRGRLSVGCSAISSGYLGVIVAVSVLTNLVTSAQGKSYLAFVTPGSYTQTGYADTGWQAVGAGSDPLVRIWIEHIVGAVNQSAANGAVTGGLWAEVLPADD